MMPLNFHSQRQTCGFSAPDSLLEEDEELEEDPLRAFEAT